ncbi:MAG: hypothetical protein Tsb0014_20250 [Pleurocapsa sp.]
MNPKILYIQYTNPAIFPPLEHSSQILAKHNWQVLFLGIGAQGAANELLFSSHPNITVRQMAFCPPGWRQKLHYIQFCLWVLAWCIYWKPKVVYASDLFSCPVALILSFLPGIRVIYHEHDTSGKQANSLFINLCFKARKLLANRSQASILPNQQRLEHFVRETATHSQTFCIWNCPTKEEVAPPKGSHLSDDDKLKLLYHGSINSSRLPLTILDAMAQLGDRVKLGIIGYETIGSNNHIQQFTAKAKQLGILEQVEFLGAMSRQEVLKRSQQYHLGLAFMPKSSNDINLKYMIGASNKAFDYLSCGLALLVSDLPDWHQAYVAPGYGLACDPEDGDSIAAALAWYLEHPTQMRQMGELGRQKIVQEWNYEKQFEPVLAYMSVG